MFDDAPEEQTDRIQEAYVAVRDGIDANAIVTWEELCGPMYFDMYTNGKMPEQGTDEWTAFVQHRCQMKIQVNKKAGRMGAEWRLYSHVPGESLIKKHKTHMVKGEIVHRMKRVAGSLSVMASAAHEMLNVMGLTTKDRHRLEQARFSAEGARLNYVGMIQSMDALDKGTKQLLLSMFDVDTSEGEEE